MCLTCVCKERHVLQSCVEPVCRNKQCLLKCCVWREWKGLEVHSHQKSTSYHKTFMLLPVDVNLDWLLISDIYVGKVFISCHICPKGHWSTKSNLWKWENNHLLSFHMSCLMERGTPKFYYKYMLTLIPCMCLESFRVLPLVTEPRDVRRTWSLEALAPKRIAQHSLMATLSVKESSLHVVSMWRVHGKPPWCHSSNSRL